MTDYTRIAKAGVLALIGLALFVSVLTGLNSLGILNGDLCHDREGGAMFHTLYDVSGPMELEGGSGGEWGRCILPRYVSVAGWELPGGKSINLATAMPTAADPRDLLLPERYSWVDGGFEIASDSLAGRVLPIVTPFLGLLFVLSVFLTGWRQWNSD